MSKGRSANPAAVAAGLIFLFAVPCLARAQSSAPPPTEPPPTTSSLAQGAKAPSRTDIFAGLQYTDDQKAKIDKVHEAMQSRRDAVIKDDKLSPEQKDAFMQGLARMERSQVYELLTPEQKAEVSKRMAALKKEERKGREKKPPSPQP